MVKLDIYVYTLIRKNTFYILIERSLVPIINFLITIYIIRKLTINEYGIYNILLAIMGYISLISSLGIHSIFQRYIPEFFHKKQIANLKKLIKQGLLLRFILAAGIILISLLFFAELIGKLFKFKDAFQYLAIFSIAIIFYIESGLLSSVLTSVFRHKKYVIAKIGYVIFRGSILYYLLMTGQGLLGILIAESISFGFLFILQALYYRRFSAIYSIQQKANLPIKRLLKFGWFSYFNEVGVQMLDVSTDYFIISAFLDPVAVGIYAFANRIMFLISRVLPQFAFINIIRPVFFTKFVQYDNAVQLNKMFNFLLKIIAFFILPIVTGIFILGDKLIIYVFDSKYLESLTVLRIVAVFYALSCFIFPTGLVLQSIEKVHILLISKIFAIYNLIADLLVVKTYGIIGIALVTSSAVLFENLFCFYFARKYSSLTIDFRGFGKIVLNSFLMGFLLYPFRRLVDNMPLFMLVIFIGLIFYLLVSYFNNAFSKQERIIINNILPKPIFASDKTI